MNIPFLIFIILTLSFSSCFKKEESTTAVADTTAPIIVEVTAVTTPATDTTPAYTFSSNEAGTITYGGKVAPVPPHRPHQAIT